MARIRIKNGFTLAEMLIAMALLGIIAVIMIPKLFVPTGTKADRAKIMQATAAITQAYSLYKVDNEVTAQTKMSDLLPYFAAYEDVPTTAILNGGIQANTGNPSNWNCNSHLQCIHFISGEYLGFYHGEFGGTTNKHGIWMLLDLDGSPSTNGKPDNPDRSIWLVLYADGKIRSWGNLEPNTQYINTGGAPGVQNACANCDPSWFQW